MPKCYLMVVRDVTERQQSAQELRHALTADHLTGVLNRRYFLERAERELMQQAQQGPACCLAMVDVDHFKSVNDSYGHAVGDAVLTSIADVLRSNVRDGDLVGRLGGEEFAVLMPAIDPDAGYALAERLRGAISALRLSHDGLPLQVTASIGIAVDGRANLKRLMIAADDALYDAKRSGRDRVCRYRVQES
jgi:diguanylate cyclase (GGDEF)-like protein